jgi:hypothetical protein
MTITVPEVLPVALTIDRATAVYFLESNLAEWGDDGPVALAWRWALTGEGPWPISGEPWAGGLPSQVTIEGESWMESGWGCLATYAEVNAARFTLWWMTAAPEAEVPQRFRHTAPAPVLYETA